MSDEKATGRRSVIKNNQVANFWKGGGGGGGDTGKTFGNAKLFVWHEMA